jgi:hypothetical protein
VTIIVGITTPDGIILASDSRMTREIGDSYRILSDSSQKIFDVGGYGVAMAGLAFIADDTIAGLMDQFLAQLDDNDRKSVDTLADALGAFFDERFAAWFEAAGVTYDVEQSGYQLLFFVAGYDDDGVGHIRQVLIPGPERGEESPDTTMPETIRGGQTDVIDRLLNGVDWDKAAIPKDALSDAVNKRLQSVAYNELAPITVQDGIDYASFLIRTTIDMQRFSDGTIGDPGLIPACGGPLQILVVERGRTVLVAVPELRAEAQR